MARQDKRQPPRKENVAGNILRHHIVRSRHRRAANDNPRPTTQTFKGILLWTVIIAVTAFMTYSQFASGT